MNSSVDKDGDLFSTFQTICDKMRQEPGHLKKTAILAEFFKRGAVNVALFTRLLLPAISNRVFNLNSKQLIKHFAKIFETNIAEMSSHLKKGDVSLTCSHFFGESNGMQPALESTLTLRQIDSFLWDFTRITKDAEQIDLLGKIAQKCTAQDLATFVRLLKKDLHIDCGPKIVLGAIGPNAYAAFQASRNLDEVIRQSFGDDGQEGKSGVKLTLMTPCLPMMAEACKSVEQAFAKCKNGILAEIKYDGERLQVHKNNDVFDYFSRNLKSVPSHKVAHLKEYVPAAFPTAKQLIIDGEILLYDTEKKQPLPFGTLGVHKKNAFKEATVCLFVFDCMYYNGDELTLLPLDKRRKILRDIMLEVPGRIMFSEQTLITDRLVLKRHMTDAIDKGLEGLVLKDSQGIYEPGKRHWLKMKRDYLESGSMADTADLVVLGAYYGTGNKGGLKSVFLMGAFDDKTNKWHTVTKVGNGFTDAQLNNLQTTIEMSEFKNPTPDWLDIHRSIVPDFLVKNPRDSPVWELTGAEFSNSKIHTARGISIRFPRVTRTRDDKTWREATTVEQLQKLFATSKQSPDIAPLKKRQTSGEDTAKKRTKKQ